MGEKKTIIAISLLREDGVKKRRKREREKPFSVSAALLNTHLGSL